MNGGQLSFISAESKSDIMLYTNIMILKVHLACGW